MIANNIFLKKIYNNLTNNIKKKIYNDLTNDY